MKANEKKALVKTLLHQISQKAGMFDENDMFQISWDNNCDLNCVKEVLTELVNKGKVKKLYFNPFEQRSSDIPIGENSYEVFSIISDKLNGAKLISL